MGSRMREVYYGEPIYRTSYHEQSRGPYARSQSVLYPESSRGARLMSIPVLELRVPMCCEKCQEKVREELQELEGVQDVLCDQSNQRVTVTGFVDPLRALKKVKKVKKKSEFFAEGTFISGLSAPRIVDHGSRYTHNRMVHNHAYDRGGLTRSSSFGRGFDRLPSFGRVGPYDRAMYDDFVQRDWYPREEVFGVRRMPSFNRHRYHDAEYISMDDRYLPFYGDTQYVSSRSERPVYLPQRSFSTFPVTNPYYIQHIDSEYW